jgi:uncharacterized protein YkvS
MQDPVVRTYDPKKYVIIFGAIPVTGFAEGTFISIARNGDIFEKSRGADGSVDRINKNAFDFSVTITIKQTSLTNDAFSAVMLVDMKNNTGVYPLTIKDLGGTTLLFAKAAWIAKDPDDENGDTLGSREWRIDTGPGTKFTGGNIQL